MNGGSYIANEYLPITTSYDFDAPLSEAGDPTEKYWKLQKVISKYVTIPSGPGPEPSEKLPYMKVSLFINVDRLSVCFFSHLHDNVIPSAYF